MTPTFMAKAKSRMTPTPNTFIARVTKNTVALVQMVRDSVSLIDWLTTRSKRRSRSRARVLADAVEHDDGVVHREADDGQDGRHRRERELLVGHGEGADDDHGVVEQRDDRARAVPEVEAEGDVDHDEQDRVEQRSGAVELQLLAGLGAHRLDLRDGGHGAGAEARVERAPDLGVEADQRHLVGVLLGAAEALHLVGVDADAP